MNHEMRSSHQPYHVRAQLAVAVVHEVVRGASLSTRHCKSTHIHGNIVIVPPRCKQATHKENVGKRVQVGCGKLQCTLTANQSRINFKSSCGNLSNSSASRAGKVLTIELRPAVPIEERRANL